VEDIENKIKEKEQEIATVKEKKKVNEDNISKILDKIS
jgi:predicted  nucleic acid-binding Zn-ribbon protein